MTSKIRRAAGDGAPQGDANLKRSALALESTDPQATPAVSQDAWAIPDFLDRRFNGIASNNAVAAGSAATSNPLAPEAQVIVEEQKAAKKTKREVRAEQKAAQANGATQAMPFTGKAALAAIAGAASEAEGPGSPAPAETEARPLRMLLPLIRDDLRQGKEAAERAGLPYFRAAGEKLLEAQASAGMSRNELVAWARRTIGISKSQVHLYISYAATTSDLSGAPDFSSLRDFERRHLGNKRGSGRGALQETLKGIIDNVEVDLLNRRQAEVKRVEEREAQRKLALQLIDLGYKALATRLHPDKGGSREAMARLNQVRDRLKKLGGAAP